MEQELTIKIQFMFFCVTALTGIVILIFGLRHKEDNKVDWEVIERTKK